MADAGSMAVYLKVPFAKGSVTAAGFEGWIRLTDLKFDIAGNFSFEHDVGNLEQSYGAVDSDSDDYSDEQESRVTFSAFSASKKLDDASGELLQFALNGQEADGEEGVFSIVICAPNTNIDGAPTVYALYRLAGALITKYELDGSGGDTKENLTIAYDEIYAEFHPHDAKLAGSEIVRIDYDLHA